MAEEWRDVVGFEGLYQVSNCGRVRSLDRFVNSKNNSRALKRGRLLKPHISSSAGYPSINLRRPGLKKTYCIHLLVCEAFHGPAPFKGAQVAHADGTRTNNKADNLRWATAKGNAKDKIKHGTAPIGEGAGNHKITESEVREIRRRYTGARGDLSWLGRKFGITKQQVRNIVHRKQWTHI